MPHSIMPNKTHFSAATSFQEVSLRVTDVAASMASSQRPGFRRRFYQAVGYSNLAGEPGGGLTSLSCSTQALSNNHMADAQAGVHFASGQP